MGIGAPIGGYAGCGCIAGAASMSRELGAEVAPELMAPIAYLWAKMIDWLNEG